MAMPSSTAMVLNSLDAAANVDLFGDESAQIAQMDVAGHKLGEGVGDGDDGFVEVPILHSSGAPELRLRHVAAVCGVGADQEARFLR